MGDAGNPIDGIEHELIGADTNAIVMKLQDLISKSAIVDLRFVAME